MKPLDLQALDSLVKPLQGKALAVFSAACATRLVRTYTTFHERTGMGSPSSLNRALDEVWKSCLGPSLLDSQNQAILAEIEDLIPKEIDDTPLIEYAADAVGAVLSSVKSSVFADFQDSTWAAQAVQESVGRYVQKKHGFSNVYGARLVEELAKCDLMIDECHRQERDALELASSAPEQFANLVERMRGRADREPALPDFPE